MKTIKSMRNSLFMFVLALSPFVFQSCGSDADSAPNSEGEVAEKAFLSKYPGAANVAWETKETYLVADFLNDNKVSEAWFDKNGIWYMTETDVLYNDLPASVKNAFSSGQYKDWRIDDIDMFERKGIETVYVLEVEKNKEEYDLYYSVDGTLVKAVLDVDSNGGGTGNGGDDRTDYLPVTLSDMVKNYISTNYPNARILDMDVEKGNVMEVDIIDGKTARELIFQANGDWIRTETEVLKSAVPQIVINVLNASEYASFRTDDIHYIETPQGNYYYFELESGSREVDLTISPEGVVKVIKISND